MTTDPICQDITHDHSTSSCLGPVTQEQKEPLDPEEYFRKQGEGRIRELTASLGLAREDIRQVVKERNLAQEELHGVGDMLVRVGGFTPDQVAENGGREQVLAELLERVTVAEAKALDLERLGVWMKENVHLDFDPSEHGQTVDSAIHAMGAVGRGLPKLFEILLDGPEELALERLRSTGLLKDVEEWLDEVDLRPEEGDDEADPTSAPQEDRDDGLIDHPYISGKYWGCKVPAGKTTYCGYSPAAHRPEHRPKPEPTTDPTHGRIDTDVQEQVNDMEPKSVGQRVAMENTIQDKRDNKHGIGLDGKCEECG